MVGFTREIKGQPPLGGEAKEGCVRIHNKYECRNLGSLKMALVVLFGFPLPPQKRRPTLEASYGPSCEALLKAVVEAGLTA